MTEEKDRYMVSISGVADVKLEKPQNFEVTFILQRPRAWRRT